MGELERRSRELQGRVGELEEGCRAMEAEKTKLQEEVNLFAAVRELINRRESSLL